MQNRHPKNKIERNQAAVLLHKKYLDLHHDVNKVISKITRKNEHSKSQQEVNTNETSLFERLAPAPEITKLEVFINLLNADHWD